jgi:hypothetical protein
LICAGFILFRAGIHRASLPHDPHYGKFFAMARERMESVGRLALRAADSNALPCSTRRPLNAGGVVAARRSRSAAFMPPRCRLARLTLRRAEARAPPDSMVAARPLPPL